MVEQLGIKLNSSVKLQIIWYVSLYSMYTVCIIYVCIIHTRFIYPIFQYGASTKPFLVHPDDPLLLNDSWIQSKRMAINIDKCSRIGFPVVFTCFCLFYAFGYHLRFPKPHAWKNQWTLNKINVDIIGTLSADTLSKSGESKYIIETIKISIDQIDFVMLLERYKIAEIIWCLITAVVSSDKWQINRNKNPRWSGLV